MMAKALDHQVADHFFGRIAPHRFRSGFVLCLLMIHQPELLGAQNITPWNCRCVGWHRRRCMTDQMQCRVRGRRYYQRLRWRWRRLARDDFVGAASAVLPTGRAGNGGRHSSIDRLNIKSVMLAARTFYFDWYHNASLLIDAINTTYRVVRPTLFELIDFVQSSSGNKDKTKRRGGFSPRRYCFPHKSV